MKSDLYLDLYKMERGQWLNHPENLFLYFEFQFHLFFSLNFFSKKTETNFEISDLTSIEFIKLTYVLDRCISVLVFQLDF